MFALESLHYHLNGIKSDVRIQDRSMRIRDHSITTQAGRRALIRERSILRKNYIEDSVVMQWLEPHVEREEVADDSNRFDSATVAIARRMGGMISLSRRGGVKKLNLSGTRVTAKQLRTVKRQLPRLEGLRALDLSSAIMQESALSQIADLTKLRALNLNHVKITNRGLSHLADLHQLQFLGLAFTDVSSLRGLRSPGELRWLFLGGSKADDKVLKQLVRAKKLQQLSMFSCDITNAGIAHLEKLPNLAILNIALTKIGDASCQSLANIQSLKELVLDETRVTENGLKMLTSLSGLRHLSLEGLQITDDGLTLLQALSNLESINVIETKVTAHGVANFRTALPNCQVQWDGDTTNYRTQQRLQRAQDALFEKETEVRRFALRELQRQHLGVCLRSGEGLSRE